MIQNRRRYDSSDSANHHRAEIERLFNCWIDSNGVKHCDPEPYYVYDTDYLRDCAP
jgi:hypothetical protein